MEINVSKKSFKRTLALFMAVLIAMSSVWMGIGVESFAAFEYELEVGNYVKVTASDERSYIRLEPEQTCRYILDGFYLCSFEYGVFLLDENKEIIEDLSDVIGISEGYTVLDLSAGEVYYLGVDFIGDYYKDDVLTFGLYSTFGEIFENETKAFCAEMSGTYVKFIPEKSGYYEVSYETESTSVYINLCDSEKNYIESIGGYSENNGKKDLLLNEGETYYFELGTYDIFLQEVNVGVKYNDNGILPGETKVITLHGGDEGKLLFIPQKSGLYRFYAETPNGNYSARLARENVSGSGEFSCPLEDGGFELIWEIYEDNTFYYYVWNNSPTSDDETCTIEVTLECLEELCNHKNHKYDEGKAPTCTENGYTDGYYCYDCEKWYLGHIANWELHNDENEDDICDFCGKGMPIASGSCGGYYDEESGSWDGSAGYVLYADGTVEIRGEGTVGYYYDDGSPNDVIIYEGITKIADDAFAFSNIESVMIPASVTEIGYSAFDCCDNLYEITVDEENEFYLSDDGVLLDKDKTVLIQYPAKKATETYVVPDSVIEIDDYAFNRNKNLVSVTISDGVISIGESAFAGCEKLQNIYMSDNVKTIYSFAFENCKSLKNIELSENLESIGFDSFYGCESLTSIAIPSRVNEISSTAFDGCINLKEYVVDERNEYFSNDENGGLLDKEKITYINCPKGNASENYIIPDGVKTIDQYAFGKCQIKGVTIPDSVETIIGAAFQHCADLKTVVMSYSVKKIISYAFIGCTNLTDVYYYGTQEDWEAIDVGYGNNALLDATIHFLGETECTHANKTSHAQQNATCTDNGYTAGEYCPDCEQWLSGHKVINAAHSWSDWTVVEATFLADGEKTRTCSECSETEKEVLAKLKGEVSIDKSTGVSVEYTGDSYAYKEMTINVVETTDVGSYFVETYEKAVAWDIKTLVNGVEAQPGAPVLVTIPIPAGFDKNMIVVYHVDSVTGNLEKIEDVQIEGDNIKFLATSFSVYMVVDESSVIEENPAESCDCKCHKSGFMSFIWKIINFFNKLFKINKTCACGEVHY